MANIEYPHNFPVLWDGVTFDRTSVGSTARSSMDAALWVSMRPSVFLALATPLPCPRSSLDWMRARLNDDEAIAPAELVFDAGLRVPLALSHEGRHRMTALKERLQDRPVPVRICLRGMSDFDIENSMIERLRSGARSQRGRSFVEGPLFEDAEIDLGGLHLSGVPPPEHCRMPPNIMK